jgi:predicted alpha/beta superfamily hydrolase
MCTGMQDKKNRKQSLKTGKTAGRKYRGRKKITGEVRYHRGFHSVFLGNERDVFVWLPPSYSLQSAKKYPVLYMHDGQNLIDPATSFMGVDWQVDETVTGLIKTGELKEIIIVGIYSTENRLEEYSDSETGRNYIKFLIEELKPFIDSSYRTVRDSKNSAVMGSSMGGLISFIIAWRYPEVFSMAGCLSSSFYYDNDKIFEMLKNYNRPPRGLKIYIDHGEDGLTRGQKMFAVLTQMGFVIGANLDYYYAPAAEHNEAAWADRLVRPLLFFFGSRQ